MSKPQLYIKNEKGRYEPYNLPKPEVDNKLYRKINCKWMNKKKLPDNINELFFGCIPRVKVMPDFSKLEKSATRKITWRNGKIIELECNKTPMSNNNDSLEDVSDMVFKTLGIRHGNLIERERELIKQ